MNAEKKTALVFVEVKKSLPKLVATKKLSQKLNLSAELKKLPDVMPRNLQDFLELLPNKLQSQAFSALENLLIIPKTVDNVCAKFIDSWRLLWSVAYNREKSDDIPSAIIESVRNTKTLLVFIWILDIDENEIVKSMTQDVDLTEEKLRRAQNMIIEALGIAQMTLQQQLDERLRIERKICQTQIYVVTIEQARKMGLLPSNPI